MKFLAQGNTITGGASHSSQLMQLECNICSMYKCHGYLIGKQVSYKIKHSNTSQNIKVLLNHCLTNIIMDQ